MPEIFLSTQVSLDGYAAGPDGDLDWTGVFNGEGRRLRLIATRSFPSSGAVQLRYRQIR